MFSCHSSSTPGLLILQGHCNYFPLCLIWFSPKMICFITFFRSLLKSHLFSLSKIVTPNSSYHCSLINLFGYLWLAIILCILFITFGDGNGTPLQYSCLENLWMEEPGRLWSMGPLRVGHHWATSLSLFSFMHWRRKWQPTPVFLPGESQGRGNLVGCCLWGHRVGHDWSDLAIAMCYFIAYLCYWNMSSKGGFLLVLLTFASSEHSVMSDT